MVCAGAGVCVGTDVCIGAIVLPDGVVVTAGVGDVVGRALFREVSMASMSTKEVYLLSAV